MRSRRTARLGASANRAAEQLASKVDTQTGEATARAAAVISTVVRLLRWPTLAVLVVPVPFIGFTLAMGLNADGVVRVLVVGAAVLMGLVAFAFGARRHRILRAVDDPPALGTELGIAVSLSGRVEETRGALQQVVGGGGWRVLSRLRGVWGGVRMTGRWIDGVGDLPRAKYFVPPKIGTTVTVTVAALWLIPISIVVAVLAGIAALAGTL